MNERFRRARRRRWRGTVLAGVALAFLVGPASGSRAQPVEEPVSELLRAVLLARTVMAAEDHFESLRRASRSTIPGCCMASKWQEDAAVWKRLNERMLDATREAGSLERARARFRRSESTLLRRRRQRALEILKRYDSLNGGLSRAVRARAVARAGFVSARRTFARQREIYRRLESADRIWLEARRDDYEIQRSGFRQRRRVWRSTRNMLSQNRSLARRARLGSEAGALNGEAEALGRYAEFLAEESRRRAAIRTGRREALRLVHERAREWLDRLEIATAEVRRVSAGVEGEFGAMPRPFLEALGRWLDDPTAVNWWEAGGTAKFSLAPHSISAWYGPVEGTIPLLATLSELDRVRDCLDDASDRLREELARISDERRRRVRERTRRMKEALDRIGAVREAISAGRGHPLLEARAALSGAELDGWLSIASPGIVPASSPGPETRRGPLTAVARFQHEAAAWRRGLKHLDRKIRTGLSVAWRSVSGFLDRPGADVRGAQRALPSLARVLEHELPGLITGTADLLGTTPPRALRLLARYLVPEVVVGAGAAAPVDAPQGQGGVENPIYRRLVVAGRILTVPGAEGRSSGAASRVRVRARAVDAGSPPCAVPPLADPRVGAPSLAAPSGSAPRGEPIGGSRGFRKSVTGHTAERDPNGTR